MLVETDTPYLAPVPHRGKPCEPAFVLETARRLAEVKGTDLEKAQCTTIRLKLLKIGAQIHVSVRRVWIRMAVGYPYKEAFLQAFENLQRIPLLC